MNLRARLWPCPFLFLILLLSLGARGQSVSIGGSTSVSGQVAVGANGTAPPPLFQVTTTTVPNGTYNAVYPGATIQTVNGVGAIACTPNPSWLPTGMGLNSACVVTGTPTAIGNFSGPVVATDSSPIPQTATGTINFAVSCVGGLQITTTSVPSGTANQAYGPFNFSAQGGVLPLTWSKTGTLPTGMSLSAVGSLSGTPTNSGTFPINVTVVDSCPAQQSATSPFSLVIAAASGGPLSFVTTSLQPVTVESASSQNIGVTGGTSPYTLTQTSGSLLLPMSSAGVVAGTVEDIIDWISIDARRGTQHFVGNANPMLNWMDADGEKLWGEKGNGGSPWDIYVYGTFNQTNDCPDVNSLPTFCHWLTENGDENAFSNPKAYKRFLTPVPLAYRFFEDSTTDVIVTPGPNTIHRTLNCELDSEAPINIGQIRGTRLPIFSFAWPFGTAPTMQINYQYSLSGGIYQAQETFSYVKGDGLVQWTVGHWNGASYTIDQTATFFTLTPGGAPPPNFPCGPSIPGWIGGNTGTAQATGPQTSAPAITSTATVKVTDNVGANVSRSFTLTVNPISAADNIDCNAGDVPNFGTTDGVATLPTRCINTALINTPASGPIKTVCASGCDFTTLNAAAAAAACGWIIKIKSTSTGGPGGTQLTYSGNSTIAKTCTAANWIIVETDQVSSLPLEGSRISPAWVGTASLHVACIAPETGECGRPPYAQPATPGIYLPKLTTTTNGLITCTTGVAFWRFIGLELTSTAGSTITDMVTCHNADHIIFDRVVSHGGDSAIWQSHDSITRNFNLSLSTNVAVIDSYVGDTHVTNAPGSSNALLGGTSNVTEGPAKFVNNFMESADSNFGVGGGGTGASTLPYCDLEIRRNHFFKPIIWKTSSTSYYGTSSNIKDMIDWKNACRGLIEGNILEQTWGQQSDQPGPIMELGSKNQSFKLFGTATSSGATVTAATGTFPSNMTSSGCATPNHCTLNFGGVNYQVQTQTSTTVVTVAPTPPTTTTAASFTAFGAGLNPNAQVSDVTVRFNLFRHASRCIEVFSALSDGGDVGFFTGRLEFHDDVCEDIDGAHWNLSNGACCAWSIGFYIANSFPSPNYVDQVELNHMTILPSASGGGVGDGPSLGFGGQTHVTGAIGHLKITNSISAAGMGRSTAGVCTTPKTASNDLICWDAVNGVQLNSYCFDHLALATTTATTGSITGTANIPPYPGTSGPTASPGCGFTLTGTALPASYDAIGFANLNHANGGDYHLCTGVGVPSPSCTGASPYHNAGSDGKDYGADIDKLNQNIAGVN